MSLNGIFRPDYVRRGLNCVLTSIAAHLGVPGATDTLGLPHVTRWVVVLVDGLGWHQLREYASTAAYLGGLLGQEPLTCGAPSSTATSLTSLGTGLPCGLHGLAGYRFRNPVSGEVMNALSWEGGPADVEAYQPHPTWFGRTAEAGMPTTNISLARFGDSALTRSAMRGASFVGVVDETDHASRIEACCDAVRSSRLVYFYERLLDHSGHAHGTGSWQWLDQLASIDDLVADLRKALPRDVGVLVTGDHGMVNVASDKVIVVENHPELEGFDMLAGEARFRHVYTSRPDEVRSRWASFLGDRAWVFTRREGIAAGLFGRMDEAVAPRFGDVMVAMRDRWVLMTNTHPIEMSLKGVHGSLTREEMQVPLLVDGPHA